MATNITKRRVTSFIDALERAGGSCGNGRLRNELGWTKTFTGKYTDIVETGRIVAGRGQGGSVRFTERQATESGTESVTQAGPVTGQRERDLYSPLKKAIESKWIHRFGLDDVVVDETHSRGSKDIGGTCTRPDITAAGIRRYVYLPKRLEIVTFEVKPAEAMSVMGVLEAIAHRETAHRSYVVYAASRGSFEAAAEVDQILELSQKFGIGVVLAESASEVETWEVVVDAVHHEPDPARLDRFLNDLPGADMKKQLSKWKE